jgi:hypothetical protein
MQFLPLTALGQELESTLEGRHSQFGLACQNTSASRLQVKNGSAWATACICGLGEIFEQLTGAAVFTFIKDKVRFL